MRTHPAVTLTAVIALCLFLGACGGSDDTRNPLATDGLTLEQLELTVVHIEGVWSEVDTIFDDTYQWRCSAGVLTGSDERLVLVTSSTCLGLSALVDSDNNEPDLGAYNLKATFAGKQSLGVTHIGETHKGLGISLLAIDDPRLAEGSAYVSLKRNEDKPVVIGDEVIAVTQRGELSGNHVFGHVTALRELAGHTGRIKYIQTDLQLRKEDTGGPLFAKISDEFFWIGINTRSDIDGQEMSFAINAKEIDASQFEWFSADGAGVVRLLSSIYGIDAHVE